MVPVFKNVEKRSTAKNYLPVSLLSVVSKVGHRKPFYGQNLPESSCVGKETVNIDILVTSRNSDRKIMESIRITSKTPSRIKKWNQLSQFRSITTNVLPIEKT